MWKATLLTSWLKDSVVTRQQHCQQAMSRDSRRGIRCHMREHAVQHR